MLPSFSLLKNAGRRSVRRRRGRYPAGLFVFQRVGRQPPREPERFPTPCARGPELLQDADREAVREAQEHGADGPHREGGRALRDANTTRGLMRKETETGSRCCWALTRRGLIVRRVGSAESSRCVSAKGEKAAERGRDARDSTGETQHGA